MTIEYTGEQLLAIDMFKSNRISILTGGPGVGKTTVIKRILEECRSGAKLVAPTGKAAKRMSEVCGRKATTIHRALKAIMDKDGKFRFIHDESTPLDCEVLIVDEMSMVTNDLAASLLRAVDHTSTKILFVGDTDQLPSIGPGAVLRDLLGSEIVPHVRLTEVMRNTGDIVKACHQIAAGRTCDTSATLDPESGQNFRHIEIDSQAEILSTIQSIVCDRMPSRGYDPKWSVQVLSPTNSRGLLSCDSLNRVLQARLNSASKGIDIGDKVIQTKNMSVVDTSRRETYIVNGDMGQVVGTIGDKKLIVRFFDPDREVAISRKNNKLLLAYCVTCHRMQGSEAPVVVIPVHTSFNFFLNRPWIYTAISRAQEILITVGQFAAIEQSISRGDSSNRKTMLREKIQENCVNDADI